MFGMGRWVVPGVCFQRKEPCHPSVPFSSQGFLEALGRAGRKVMGGVKSTRGRLPTANQHLLKGGQAHLPGRDLQPHSLLREEVMAADTPVGMVLSCTPMWSSLTLPPTGLTHRLSPDGDGIVVGTS